MRKIYGYECRNADAKTNRRKPRSASRKALVNNHMIDARAILTVRIFTEREIRKNGDLIGIDLHLILMAFSTRPRIRYRWRPYKRNFQLHLRIVSVYTTKCIYRVVKFLGTCPSCSNEISTVDFFRRCEDGWVVFL